ncbi:hypothetical protein FA13DRAFT_1085277 [Coprinellus micaceus]|uniref:F-box domain-containing protein n=1 Tax=Coprinellus micaceus TaxID=71717 RepID=A0A4Y7TRJ1_COPMI|nr:hypothetical protein FA13DRAFT_1085277 [Coprinellus micaceus]
MPFPLPLFSGLRLRCKEKEIRGDDGSGTLPCEILHIIFAMVMEVGSLDPDLVEQHYLRSSIFSISQVCRHWRLAARDCSPLLDPFHRLPATFSYHPAGLVTPLQTTCHCNWTLLGPLSLFVREIS